MRQQQSAAAPAETVRETGPQFAKADTELSVFPWEQFRPRLRVPSRSVWTYWDLGADFGPAPDETRRELFKTILGHLKWPGGTVTFWPLNFLDGGQLKAHPGQFWRGVREARAQVVFCFGQRAFQALFPRKAFGFAPITRGDVVVHPLPGPVAMLAGDAQSKAIVWRTLSSFRFPA